MENIKESKSPELKEFGGNVEITVHFMRHGEKDDITLGLTEGGKIEAEELGKKFRSEAPLKFYLSNRRRIRETAEAITEGLQQNKTMRTRIRSELSADSVFTGSRDKSTFMKKVNEQRLAAYKLPEEEREEALKRTEAEYMGEWLKYGDQRPDEGTASPEEIARDMAFLLDRYIRMADRLRNGSRVELVNITHEFMVAALIRYLLYKEGGGGPKDGKKIMERLGRISPLEDVKIIIKTTATGEKSVRVNLKGEEYKLNQDKMKELLTKEP